MSPDNNSKGIILILIAMSLFSMQDALIKFIFEQSALYEIFFGRYLVAAIVLFIYLSFKGQKVSLKTHYPLLTFIRVLLHFIPINSFKKNLANIETKKGHEKNKALAVASCI